MQKPISREVRRRFEKLMRLAAESPYPGERANARAAASRLAADHGMSLDEVPRAEVDLEAEADANANANANARQWQGSGGFQRQDYDAEEQSELDWLRQYVREHGAERKELLPSGVKILMFCWIVVIAFGLINSASRDGLLEFLQFGLAVP